MSSCRYAIFLVDEDLVFKKTRYADDLPDNVIDGAAAIDTIEKQSLVYRQGQWQRIPKPPVAVKETKL
jgi:hypothetical protein